MVAPKTSHRNSNHVSRSSTEMDIFEHPREWLAKYQEWVANYEQNGEFDWKKYARPRNSLAPSGPGINLAESRLLFITSAGAYLRESQPPFDAENPFGDYSLRLFPADTPFEDLAFAHDHYDHSYVQADPQVLLPLRHLESAAAEGRIGGLAASVVSFMGYQPNAIRVAKELIPAILKVARDLEVQAALLVPT